MLCTQRAEGYHGIRSMEVIRCDNCNKKLAEADYRRLAIKCPRCGAMNNLKATEPLSSANSAQKEKPGDHDP